MPHRWWMAGLLVCLMLAVNVCAHEGTHEQIAAKTRQIEQHPKRAELYWDRAELFREHRDWDSAFADYERAAALDPQLAELDLGRGRLLLAAGWPKSAKLVLGRFLSKKPNHSRGHQIYGDVLSRLAEPLAAAAEYSRAIILAPRPIPELYIARARALRAAGPGYLDEALLGLDRGMAKFGKPIVTLQLPAIELELAGKRYDAALKRLETIAAQSPRKERWLAQRGDILRRAKRIDEACQAYRAALAAIESLPRLRRRTEAVSQLEKRVRAALGPCTQRTNQGKDKE